jgi:hypothetical protein
MNRADRLDPFGRLVNEQTRRYVSRGERDRDRAALEILKRVIDRRRVSHHAVIHRVFILSFRGTE